jgi:hypothetical protein
MNLNSMFNFVPRKAIRQSGNPAIRQSGNPAIRQSGNPAIRQSGNPAILTYCLVSPTRQQRQLGACEGRSNCFCS